MGSSLSLQHVDVFHERRRYRKQSFALHPSFLRDDTQPIHNVCIKSLTNNTNNIEQSLKELLVARFWHYTHYVSFKNIHELTFHLLISVNAFIKRKDLGQTGCTQTGPFIIVQFMTLWTKTCSQLFNRFLFMSSSLSLIQSPNPFFMGRKIVTSKTGMQPKSVIEKILLTHYKFPFTVVHCQLEQRLGLRFTWPRKPLR